MSSIPGFIVAPILFGLDKFVDWLVDWRIYLAPQIDDLIPGNAHQAMLVVGGIEIVAGSSPCDRRGVATSSPRCWPGSSSTCSSSATSTTWPCGDFGLLLAAVALARLATAAELTSTIAEVSADMTRLPDHAGIVDS